MKKPRLKVYRDMIGEYRWRLTASNGRIVADGGEGYKTKHGAERAAAALPRILTAATTP